MQITKDPKCVAACRHFVENELDLRSVQLIDRAVLVASELVTNVIRHTPNGGLLELVIAREKVRLEVSDRSREPLALLPYNRSDANGRGLALVSCLATEWGFHETLHWEDGLGYF